MNTNEFLSMAWRFNPLLLVLAGLACGGYFIAFGGRGRPGYFVAAGIIFVLALASPLGTLADGYLFSAHMIQHILFLLIVPALLLLSLPQSFQLPVWLRVVTYPVLGWVAGVGAMWLWHAPILCNAASVSSRVFALQTTSLILLGSLFWWQIIAPRESDRLSPAAGIAYLFTACVACSVLGMILTFAPVSLCPAYQHPADQLGLLGTIRGQWGLTSERDQQIGGLLMWVPMCLIYATAILAQFARFHADAPQMEKHHA